MVNGENIGGFNLTNGTKGINPLDNMKIFGHEFGPFALADKFLLYSVLAGGMIVLSLRRTGEFIDQAGSVPAHIGVPAGSSFLQHVDHPEPLQAAIDDPRRADKAGAILALVGVVNVPIIYFSVKWWNTLHQGASVSLTSAPTMAATMFLGMIVMAFGFWSYAIAVTLWRVRCIVLEREHPYAGVGEGALT